MSDHLKRYSSQKYRAHQRYQRQVRNEEGVMSKFDSRSPRRNHVPKFVSSHDQQCKYLSQDEIRVLAQSQPADVLASAGENESGFLATYRHDRYYNKSLTLKHLIKMLYLLVKADDLHRITSRVLARLFCPDATYAGFLFKLDQLIKEMVSESKGHVRRENPQYLNYLTEIGIKAITIIPKTILSTFPVLSIKETVQCLSRDGDVSDSLKRKVRSLENLFAVADRKKSEAHVKDVSLSGPSEHFVDMDILPSLDEVFSDDSEVYLPANIVRGEYKNWDHYLDVQYRLMREDFLRPLRHGIQHFISTSKSRGRREENIRVYENIRIQNPVCLNSGVGFQVHFDVSRLTKVNWEHSKRLIFGSLLCLSKDGYQHSIMFASVVKNDSALLKDGFLTVKFEGDISGFHLNPNDVFTMAESMAYFEAYRHILSKLKEISSTSDTIPFKRYIVDCKLRDIPLPSYSLHKRQLQFDLKDTLEIKSDVMINVLSSWPLPSYTCLDESQLDALRMALTKEVSLIQGPPGTGKTFIGLKVVEAFLRNRSIWDCNKEAPILVVCYTNHALDQFLEGIQKIALGKEKPNIVRIGGRCKSKQLSSCILRNKVEEFRSKHELPRFLLRELSEAHSGTLAGKNEIHQLLSGSSSTDKNVRCLSELKSVMLYRHFCQLEALHSEDGREVEMWLELRCSSFSESKQDSDSGCEVVMLEDVKKNIDISTAEDYIDVDNDVKLLEEDRAVEGEDIELSAPPNSKLPNASVCVTVHVDNAKRRKIEVKHNSMSIEEVCSVTDVLTLPLERKWSLYNYWIKQCSQHDTKEMRKHIDQYNQWCEKHADCRKKIDEYILRGTDVIGMTTTGAAKHHHILKSIHPKIVIFEEAAEIFEAHVITSLTPSVQQLVLIGDHKQLKPKPNSYDLEVKYGLAVSLFERMVKNGIDYVTLGVQHRMRPEISSLIHPSIYPELKDHESVTNYENIRGVAKNVFMISHTQPEKNEQASDVTTHINEFEAQYLVALCCHLFKQGYQPHQITILTMYRGQLFELRRRMTRETFEGIRVAVVDDFQGEENDIILLSLVRSNCNKSIGFLGESNRICVSLSRAKIGLYIIGNLDMLRDKESTVWPKIISDLEKKSCVGSSLPLYCRVHKASKVWAEFPEDFLKCPEGGCEKKCGVRLTCGHVCPRICHPNDMSHQNYKCLKECGEVLPCDHRCVRKCYECAMGCRPCSATVKRVIPLCNHKVTMPCGSNPSSFACPALCKNTLPCGHVCQNSCSKPCTRKCHVEVNKELQCEHQMTTLCYQAAKAEKCLQKCNTVLDCGDKCRGTCGECHMGRLHKSCNRDCGRQLVCGHACDFPCASKCPPCMKLCNNFCVHSRCPKKCYESCTPCREPCQWRCKHFKCTLYCGEICDRPPCDKPCERILECGHPCISLCGENCPSLCRICDKEVVCEIFFGTEDEEDARFVQLEDCGHLIEVGSLDTYFENDVDSPGEVKFIDCPRCRTPIRTSLRYCNKVKRILKDVEEIKRRQLILKDGLKEKFLALKLKAAEFPTKVMSEEMASLGCNVSIYKTFLPYRVHTIFVQINILTAILNVLEILSAINESVADQCKSRYAVCDTKNIMKDLSLMKSFVFQDFLSNQQVLDITAEARRASCAAKLCKFLCEVCVKKSQLSQDHEQSILHCIQIVHESGWKLDRLSEDGETGIITVIKDVSKVYGVGVGLSEKEKVMVVQAIGLSKGRWFKCANGHYYCIGECGGAMVTSTCPECGLVIGGQNHLLAGGNQHAPEMDNSRYPAWSEAANLANFDLDIP